MFISIQTPNRSRFRQGNSTALAITTLDRFYQINRGSFFPLHRVDSEYKLTKLLAEKYCEKLDTKSR